MSERKLRIFTTSTCGDCRVVKRWLDRNAIAYEETDVAEDPEAREFVRRAARGHLSVPTVLFEDGTVLVEPSRGELEAALARVQG